MKDSRAVASNDLSERRLVFRACLTRQFEVRRLFVTVRQKRSSFGFGGHVVHESAISAGGGLLVVARFARFAAFAAMRLELRFQLFKLGLLLRGQNGLHFLIELKSLAHQLGLQARHFR